MKLCRNAQNETVDPAMCGFIRVQKETCVCVFMCLIFGQRMCSKMYGPFDLSVVRYLFFFSSFSDAFCCCNLALASIFFFVFATFRIIIYDFFDVFVYVSLFIHLKHTALVKKTRAHITLGLFFSESLLSEALFLFRKCPL